MAETYTEVSSADLAEILAEYREITMPEGAVQRIRRKSDGAVLWESASPGAAPLMLYSDTVQAGMSGILYNA